MKTLLAVVSAQGLLSCASLTEVIDPDAPCHDQLADPTPADVVGLPDEAGGFSTSRGPRPYRDCDLRCRDFKHSDHWTECGCSRSCNCFDAARSWNIPEARGQEPR